MEKKSKWTKETVSKKAQNYQTRKEFETKSGGAYAAAVRLGILSEVCSHMVCGRKKWTKETIPEEAQKYKSRKEFETKTGGAYKAAIRLGILDKVCSHMKTPELSKKRCVYVFIFEDYSYYVGLTYSFKKRYSEHKRSNRFKEKAKKNISYIYEHTDLMPYKEAQKLEKEWIKKYESLGYKKLNKVKGGSLGGGQVKWTRENIPKEAKKYKTRKEFQTKSRGAYAAAGRLGILSEVCSHMPKLKGKWTKETIPKEAQNYKTRKEFETKSGSAYQAARRLSILDEVCSHMVCGRKNRTVLKFPNKKTNINNTKKAA